MSRPEPQGEAETEGEIHSAMRTICQCPVVGRANEGTANFSRSCHSHPRCLSVVAFYPSGRLTRPPLRNGRWDGQAGCHVASKSVIMLTIVLETAYLAISGDGRAALITASAPRCLFLLGITGIPSGMEEGVLGLPHNQVKESTPTRVRWRRRKKNQCMGKGAEKVERTPPPP